MEGPVLSLRQQEQVPRLRRSLSGSARDDAEPIETRRRWRPVRAGIHLAHGRTLRLELLVSPPGTSGDDLRSMACAAVLRVEKIAIITAPHWDGIYVHADLRSSRPWIKRRCSTSGAGDEEDELLADEIASIH